jgi:CRISPR-associated endoribonuclease Cas6
MMDYGTDVRRIASWIHAILAKHDPGYAENLKKNGIRLEKKVIKPYVFSRPYQKKDNEDRYVIQMASPDPKFMYSLLQGATAGIPDLHLSHGNVFTCQESPRLLPVPKVSTNADASAWVTVFTMSPVIIRGKSSCLVAGHDDLAKVQEALTVNLLDKYRALKGNAIDNPYLKVTPKEIHPCEVKFQEDNGKHNTIIGNVGRFALSGSPELINMALLCGLGAKNGLGFGCIDVHKPY